MSKRLFVYGSLLNDEVTDALLGAPLSRQPATLHGYQRVVVKGESYPGIFVDESACVEGQVITGLTAEQWQQLDTFEGEYYARETVTVTLATGVAIACDVYVIKPEYVDKLSSEPWSNRHFRETLMNQFVAGYSGYSRCHP